MEVIRKYALLALLFAAFTSNTIASATPAAVDTMDVSGEEHGDEFKPGDVIMHHIADAHEWHLLTIPAENGHHETHVTLPLPVIVYSGTRGLEVFSSHNFVDSLSGHPNTNHGFYKEKNLMIDHGHITSTVAGEHIWDISITKNVASILISAVLLILVFFIIAARYKKNALVAPKGIQSFFEPIILFVRDDIAKNFIGEKAYTKFLPYLLTLFFFIWFNNLLGLLPGGANVTGNITITVGLAVLTFLITNLSANWHYWKHILWTPGVPLPLRIIILPIEVVGIVTKPFSLAIRLFANITAGHIIILSFICLIFIFQSLWMSPVTIVFGIFMNVLELLVAILQAYIFTMLTAMYIGSAVEDHGHEPDIDHGH